MSTLTVQNIQGSSSSSNTISVASGHKISGAAGSIVAPGQVIQVQQGLYTSNTSFTNTSMAASDLTVNITPTSTSSKILLLSSCQMGYPGQNYGVTMTFLSRFNQFSVYNKTGIRTYR